MNATWWWCAVSYVMGIGAGVVITPLVILLAKRFKVLDMPDARKVHTTPTPRIGGLAIAVSTLAVAVPIVLYYRGDNYITSTLQTPTAAMYAAAVALLCVGFLDDLLNVSSKVKLLVLLGVASAFCAYGGRIPLFQGGAGWKAYLPLLSWPITMLWLISVPISLNFADGLDGLAAGISAVACLVTAVVAAAVGEISVAVLMLSMLGALTAFLLFNFNPARIFMGDCGSLFIGFVIAACGVITCRRSGSPAGVLIPAVALSIPLLDMLLTIVRRVVLKRRSLFAAERGHVHHRLLDLGLCQRHAVLLLYFFSAATGVIALAAYYGSRNFLMLSMAMLAVLLLTLFRTAGSARAFDTVKAIRRNRALGRESRKYRSAFEAMQLRFARASTFDAWWAEICEAAAMLSFSRVSMPIARRDGSTETRLWHTADLRLAGAPTVNAALPLAHRRLGAPMRVEVDVPAPTFLESAGHRLALFARLLEEHSLATLPERPGPFRFRLLNTSRGNGAGGKRRRLGGLSSNGTVASVEQLNRETLSVRFAKPESELSVAVVHDFLYTYAGAERVLEQILNVFPQAQVFSLFDFLKPGNRAFIQDKPVHTSFIQRLPLASKKHRAYLPLMPLAIEQLDVSSYDIVVSSSYLVAKGVLTRPDQLHVCYCHTPVRFAWDLQHQYLSEAGLTAGLKSLFARLVLHYTRIWDVRSTAGVDAFLTNSQFVGRRIEKIYGRTATTIYPPVDTDSFALCEEKGDYYLAASRLVPYKRIDLIVEAFSRMPNRRLVVVGEGPEMEKIKAIAGPNVKLVGYQPFDRLREYMQHARAFIFAAEEDFGIVPVEAQSCGTPVIAYGRGGVTESVLDGVTGVFFMEQTVESLVEAVGRCEKIAWDAGMIRQNALRFSPAVFREKFSRYMAEKWREFGARRLADLAAAGSPDLSPGASVVAGAISGAQLPVGSILPALQHPAARGGPAEPGTGGNNAVAV